MKKSQKKKKNDMDNEKTVADVFNTLTEEQKTVVYTLTGQVLEDNEKTLADVFNTLTEEQKTVVYALIGQALEDNEKYDEEDDGGRNKENEA